MRVNLSIAIVAMVNASKTLVLSVCNRKILNSDFDLQLCQWKKMIIMAVNAKENGMSLKLR